MSLLIGDINFKYDIWDIQMIEYPIRILLQFCYKYIIFRLKPTKIFIYVLYWFCSGLLSSVFIPYNDSLDWKDLSAEQIFNRVTDKVGPGSIVLFHNAAKHTPEALPKIIEKLQSDGYNLIPISEIIHTDNYEIDNNGRQIKRKTE